MENKQALMHLSLLLLHEHYFLDKLELDKLNRPDSFQNNILFIIW